MRGSPESEGLRLVPAAAVRVYLWHLGAIVGLLLLLSATAPARGERAVSPLVPIEEGLGP